MIQDVNNGYNYGLLVINSGASEQLMQYITGVSSIPPSIDFYYDQARDGASYQFLLGSLGNSLGSYINSVLTYEILSLMESTPPQLIINKSYVTRMVNIVQVVTNNLHEVDRYGFFVFCGAATLNMYLIMLVHTLGMAPTHAALEGHGIKRSTLINFQISHRIIGAFLLAFWPPAIMLILGSNDRHIVHNPYTFFQLWGFIWLCFAVFGAFMVNLFRTFGSTIGVLLNIILLNFMNAGTFLAFNYICMYKYIYVCIYL